MQAVMLRLLTRCRRARCGSRSSTRSAWARTSPPSCTWPTTTSSWSRSRIWTEPAHIEQRLADLTEHMENVIQKYLRNEFAIDRGIQRARRRSGRAVPRPGRRQLPGQLHAEAAARGWSASSTSGAALRRLHADQRRYASCRCRATSDLRRPGSQARQRCVWNDGTASSGSDADFGRFPLDARRAAGGRTRSPRSSAAVGERGQGRRPRRSAVRVHRAAAETSGGPRDSRSGIDVPLGRAGATKRQHLRARQGHVAARADRRQDRLGQIDAAARADHQPRAALQPRRGRILPDRLQERASSSRPTPRTSCRTPGSSPSRASASSA